MSKNALPLLTGGLNEVTRSDIIDNTELQVCENYEVTGDGVLSKRGAVEEYDANLSTSINDFFSKVIHMSEPYYPANLLTDNGSDYEQSSSFILLIYGLTHENKYELHAFYKTTNNIWQKNFDNTNNLNDLLLSSGIEYTQDSVLEFNIAQDKVVITDNINRAHYFKVDFNGNPEATILGIPAPKQAAKIKGKEPDLSGIENNINEIENIFDLDAFTDDAQDSRLGNPGYVKVTYTVVNNEGVESNPAPLSETLDLSYHAYDDDKNRTMWIDKINITNLVLPSVSDSVAETLEFFKVYIRIMPYSNGLEINQIEFTESFPIIVKFDANNQLITSGESGNNYTITIEPTPGQGLSYENDVAPIAKTSAYIGGVNMLGNIQDFSSFPYKFQYNHSIEIKNKNTSNLVDAVIAIKIKDVDLNTESNNYFNLTDYFVIDNDGSAYIPGENLRKLRFYDTDRITPLQVYFAGAKQQTGYITNNVQGDQITHFDDVNTGSNNENNFFVVWVKVPLLTAHTTKIIYFCWDSNAIIPVEENTMSLGRIQQPFQVGLISDMSSHIGSTDDNPNFNWHGNTVWTKSNAQSIYDTDVEVKVTFDELPNTDDASSVLNRANINNNVDTDRTTANLVNSYEYDSNNSINKANTPQVHSLLHNILKDDSYHIGQKNLNPESNRVSLKTHLNTNQPPPATTKLYAYCWVEFVHSNSSSKRTRHLFTASNGSTNKMAIGFIAGGIDGTSGNVFLVYNSNPIDTNINIKLDTVGTHQYFIGVSFIDEGEKPKISIFIKYLSPHHEDYNETKWAEIEIDESSGNGIGEFDIQNYHWFEDASQNGFLDSFSYAIDNMAIVHNEYLSADEKEDVQKMWNIAHQQMPIKNQIGYYIEPSINSPDPDTFHYNENIVFTKTIDVLKLEKYRNMVRWSNVNSNAMPELNFKLVKEPVQKIIAAPSFLQYQYQNTFLIFTRNNIHRFILTADIKGWTGSSSTLIDEKTQYGLLAPRSLVRVAEGLFWLSETGIIKWDPKGFNLISKNRVNVPIEENSIGFYNSINNQYIIYNDTLDEFGVFKTAYVYHIDRDMWTKFKFQGQDLGFETNMESIISTAVLTGGSQLDNVNLFLVKNGNGYSVNKYPSENKTIINSNIQTKDMYFEKGVLKRVQLNHKPGSNIAILQTNVTKNDKNGNEIIKTNTIPNIENGKYRGIANKNSRGKSVNFVVSNSDEIDSIIYDIKIQGNVKQ